MQNLTTNTEALLQHFQVEELEERLENREWVADCVTYCYSNDCTETEVTKCS